MSDLSTKQKILNATILLFNKNGVANVRLHQIANEIGISPGNLAYHFKNKEAIITALSEEIYEETDNILETYRIFPNLIDFDNQLMKYFSFIERYPFYFLDLVEIERIDPQVRSTRQIHNSKMISQIRKRFDFNYSRGFVIEEPREGIYDIVARSIWTLITFYVLQNTVRGEKSSISVIGFKEIIWNQIYPYFTDQGISEFNQLITPMLKQKP